MGRRRIEDVSKMAKAFFKPIKSTRTPVTLGGSRGTLTRTAGERALSVQRVVEESVKTGRQVEVRARKKKKKSSRKNKRK